MARVTVEDCIDKVENRFELVAVGAQRAKDLAAGGELHVSNEKHEKFTVLALRELAADKVEVEDLRKSLVNNYVRPFGAENNNFEYDDEDAEIASTLENVVIPGADGASQGSSESMELSEEEIAALQAEAEAAADGEVAMHSSDDIDEDFDDEDDSVDE